MTPDEITKAADAETDPRCGISVAYDGEDCSCQRTPGHLGDHCCEHGYYWPQDTKAVAGYSTMAVTSERLLEAVAQLQALAVRDRAEIEKSHEHGMADYYSARAAGYELYSRYLSEVVTFMQRPMRSA